MASDIDKRTAAGLKKELDACSIEYSFIVGKLSQLTAEHRDALMAELHLKTKVRDIK